MLGTWPEGAEYILSLDFAIAEPEYIATKEALKEFIKVYNIEKEEVITCSD